MKIYKDSFFQHQIYEETQVDQGWKIHVHSEFNDAVDILKVCKKIALETNTNFKFVHNFNRLKHFKCNETYYKFAGKFITFYIGDDNYKLNLVINKLYEKLNSYEPFKIIGDKNFKNTIINYRYGSFNSSKHYIISKNNKQIQDTRIQYIPENSEIIDPISNNDYKFSNHEIVLNEEYKIIDTLSFSNSGGIYLAKNISDNFKYVLKEYRFYNFEKNSSRENEIIFSDKTPRFIKKFIINNSAFYVYEYVLGTNLDKINPKNFKLIITLITKILELMESYHKKNIILNDVKTSNFIYSKNKIFFVDKEHCYYKENRCFEIENTFLTKNGLSRFLNPKLEDRSKLAELIIDLLKLRTEVFYVKYNLKIYLSYLKIIFIKKRIPMEIYKVIVELFYTQKKLRTISKSLLSIDLKKLEVAKNDIAKIENFFHSVDSIKMEKIDFLNELKESDLYAFIFEKIINQNIHWKTLDAWSKLNLNAKNFEDRLKIILLWKYKYFDIDVENYLLKIVSDFIVKKNSLYFVKNNGYLIPYIQDGLGILSLIIIEVIEKIGKENIDVLETLLIKFHNSFKNFPIEVTKTSFLFGSAGIAFLIKYVGDFLQKNSTKKAKEKLINLYFMQNNYKWQTQENVKLDDTFLNGNTGIIWTIKFITKK